MKHHKRRKLIIVSIVAVLLIVLVIAVVIKLPKPVKSSDTSYDLSQIANGSYLGFCDNGLVKVQVEVQVQDHTIADVRLIQHDNGLGSAAEVITDEIVRQQSIEIDAISGATMSSKTILKAVEHALTEGGKINE